jgi:glycine dehydrogenase subunit 1
MSEAGVYERLAALAAPQRRAGAGLLPRRGDVRPLRAGVLDAITQRSEFLTPYTPYQPEISGGLQAMFEFQTAMSD